eukprot:359884-Chlamydomonas_euryale.AAC.5
MLQHVLARLRTVEDAAGVPAGQYARTRSPTRASLGSLSELGIGSSAAGESLSEVLLQLRSLQGRCDELASQAGAAGARLERRMVDCERIATRNAHTDEKVGCQELGGMPFRRTWSNAWDGGRRAR